MLNDNKFTCNENRNYWTFQQVMSTINEIQSQRVIIDGQVKVIQNQEFTINYAYQRVEEWNTCNNLFLNFQ